MKPWQLCCAAGLLAGVAAGWQPAARPRGVAGAGQGPALPGRASRLAQARSAVAAHQWRRAAILLAGLQGNTVTEAAEILHLRGLAEQGLGRRQAAAEDLQRAVVLDPSGTDYAADAGLAMLAANAGEAASRDLEAAARQAPGEARLWRALAVADLRMGRNREAAAAARHAIALGPATADLYLLVAQALGDDGQIGAALAAARKAAALIPQSPNVHLAIGILLAQRTPPDRAGAEKELRLAETLAPNFAPASLQLGKLWLSEGRVRLALTQLERVRRQAPGLDEAIYLLAQAYARSGDRSKAAALMQAYEMARRRRRQRLANQPLPTFIVQ